MAFHEEEIILPDDDGCVPSSLFSFSCDNFDKICFAPTERANLS